MYAARDLRDLATLLRWLGPWAKDAEPTGVERSSRTLRGDKQAYLYAPRGRAPAGAYLVAQGLHFLGPDDPRMDRFCRALAASGLLVLAPFLHDFLRLRLSPGATHDLAEGFDDLEAITAERGLPPPAVFSISFGSMPAVELCGRASHRDRVGTLVIFGGFADFGATVRFAISGVAERGGERVTLPRDPLNSPAVFLNILPFLGILTGKKELEAAWRTMIRRTWGRMELKAPGARDPIAHEIAERIPHALRDVFLTGCGLRSGGLSYVQAGLDAAGSAFDFFDPKPHLARVRAPVFVLHGRNDDVIPWFEAERIRDALPAGHPHRLHVTGMASHSGVGMPPVRELVREGFTMLASAEAISSAPRAQRGRTSSFLKR